MTLEETLEPSSSRSYSIPGMKDSIKFAYECLKARNPKLAEYYLKMIPIDYVKFFWKDILDITSLIRENRL